MFSRFTKMYGLQLFVVVVFVAIYLFVRDALQIPWAHLLVAPIVGSFYFLLLKYIFHTLRLYWIIISTIVIVLLLDFIIPFAAGRYEVLDAMMMVNRLPLIAVIACIEIFVEEEVELVEERLEAGN